MSRFPTRRYTAAVCTILCALVWCVRPAAAAVYATGAPHVDQWFYLGTAPDGPTFQRPSAGLTPTTLAPGGPVPYARADFVAPRAGNYELSLFTLSGGGLYLYRDAFDPGLPLQNLRRAIELRPYDVGLQFEQLGAGQRMPLVVADTAYAGRDIRVGFRLDAPRLGVPVGQTTRFTINVPDNFQVGAVNGLTVWTDWLRMSDLTISLVHDGVRVTLLDRPNVIVDTEGDEPFPLDLPTLVYRDALRFADGGLDPQRLSSWFDGGYQNDVNFLRPRGPMSPQNPAENPLSAFAGMHAGGEWTLEITAGPGFQDSSITGFELDLSPIPEPSMLTIVGLAPLLLSRRRLR
jgi:hypothetical protein